MRLFCWINSVAGWSDGGAETALMPIAIPLEFLNQKSRGWTSLEVSALSCFMVRIE